MFHFKKLKVHIKQRLHRILSKGILSVMVSLLSYQSLSACKDVGYRECVLLLNNLTVFPENIHTHPWRVIRNSKKEGGHKGHIFKGIYIAELEIAEGLGEGGGFRPIKQYNTMEHYNLFAAFHLLCNRALINLE